MSVIRLPFAPDRPDRLRAFALGPLLLQWSDSFQPDLLDSASQALDSVRALILSASAQLEGLTASKAAGLYTAEEIAAEESRLTALLDRQIAMLERLGNFHARATSVSAAALLHAMTRGDLSGPAIRQERDVAPRRSLASASDLLVD